ncbi:MAG: hypothetical protein J6B02_05600 [Selenomonadales bacterium]|nr:hypothetical protein [Selenomonadales bacterium]
MMMHLLLMICLMMTMLMPCAWADTWGEKEANEWKEILSKTYKEAHSIDSVDLRLNSPLAKLIIKSDEWFEGDTYYIRYTFTNPADEKIDETVIRTLCGLYAGRKYDISSAIIKRDPAPEWSLRIEPHSSMTHTIMLPKEPAFAHFFHESTHFYLSSGGSIEYTWSLPNITPPAKIDFCFEPIALNVGTLTLTVTNQSNEMLSSLKNILISYEYFTDGVRKKSPYPLSDSFSLNLAPNESTSIRLSTPIPYYLTGEPAIHAVFPEFEIDGIRYFYSPLKDNGPALFHRTISYFPRNLFLDYPPPEVSITGTMEFLYGYPVYFLTFYNDTDKTQILRTLHMSSFYENHYYSQRAVYAELSLENNPIVLHPHEGKRYYFPFILLIRTPQQFLESVTVFNREFTYYTDSEYLPKIINRPLHPMQRALYQPLDFTITDLRANQYFYQTP